MKQIIAAVLLVAVFFPALGQYPSVSKENAHYIFPEFIQGTVLKKSNETVSTLLNYNTLTEEMIFMDSDKALALDETEKIDTVYLQNRRFIPVGKVFYEVATQTPVPLFIQHKSKLIAPGKSTGFGTSQTSSITSITSMLGRSGAYKLTLPSDYTVISKITYWLRKNGVYTQMDNLKDIQAMFPEKANLIREFVKENKLRFEKPEDVAKMVVFCN